MLSYALPFRNFDNFKRLYFSSDKYSLGSAVWCVTDCGQVSDPLAGHAYEFNHRCGFSLMLFGRLAVKLCNKYIKHRVCTMKALVHVR